MSRQLPAHPNLEHLRNQAKDLLRELQQQNPSLKLADALDGAILLTQEASKVKRLAGQVVRGSGSTA